MDTTNAIAAERIRALRVAAGMRQEDLADKTNIHRQIISKIEQNKKNITVTEAAIFAHVFEVPVGYILGMDDNSDALRQELIEKADSVSEYREITQAYSHGFRKLMMYELRRALAEASKDMFSDIPDFSESLRELVRDELINSLRKDK